MRELISRTSAAGRSRETGRYSRVPGQPQEIELWRHEGDIVNWQLRVACKNCNTGWMRHLEEEAYPVVKKLVLGESVTISKIDLQLVSRWITQVWLVTQYMKRDWILTPQHLRTAFRQRPQPLQGCQIWITTYGGTYYQKTSFGMSNSDLSQDPEAKDPSEVDSVAIFCCWIGSLFIHVHYSSNPKHFATTREEFAEIFPNTPDRIEWPRIRMLDGDVYDVLAKMRAAFQMAEDWAPWLTPTFLAPR